jgi:hypothetical protein
MCSYVITQRCRKSDKSEETVDKLVGPRFKRLEELCMVERKDENENESLRTID